jgi:hypothetical protein
MRFSRLGYWGPMVAGIGLLAVGAIVINVTLPGGPTPAKGLALGVLATVSAGIALLSYRSADEVILETHKSAWFWGCMATCMIIAPLVIAISWRLIPVPVLLPRHEAVPADYFVEGMAFVVLIEAGAYLAFAAYHQIRRVLS